MAPQRAFTLTELMLIVAVLAILVTAGLPSFSDLIGRHRLRGAAEDLYAGLLLARTEAMRRNVPVTVSFRSDPEDGRWCHALSDRGPCDCLRDGDCALDGGVPRAAHSRDFAGVRLSTNFTPQQAATFHPARGTANAGTARLSNGAGSVDVVVSSQGRVRLCAPASPDYPPC